jgi:hypothetical protein
VKLVRSALVVTAGALLPLLPVAAHANGYVSGDATDDVVSFPVSDGGRPPETPAAGRAQGDVIASSVAHRRRKVMMRLQYRELEPTGAAGGHLFVIRTRSTVRLVTVFTGPGYWDGKVVVENGAGRKVRCAVARQIDYVANTATVVMPRSCLGNPAWVRVGMAGLTFDTLDSVFADDARAAGSVGKNPVYGPRVRR